MNANSFPKVTPVSAFVIAEFEGNIFIAADKIKMMNNLEINESKNYSESQVI